MINDNEIAQDSPCARVYRQGSYSRVVDLGMHVTDVAIGSGRASETKENRTKTLCFSVVDLELKTFHRERFFEQYSAACTVEFQPPIGRTHCCRFSYFYEEILVRASVPHRWRSNHSKRNHSTRENIKSNHVESLCQTCAIKVAVPRVYTKLIVGRETAVRHV